VASVVNQSPNPIAPPNHFLPTPVKRSPLINLLSCYEQTIFNQLIYGFSFGFSLHFDGETLFLESKNLSSALEHPSIVDMKLTEGISGLSGGWSINSSAISFLLCFSSWTSS
jgi:hypothetical protein